MIKEKKIYKIIFVIIIMFTILFAYNTKLYATDKVMEGAASFLEIGKNSEDILNDRNIKLTSDNIYNIFVIIGSALVLIVGAILGLMFIFGSVEEKVKVKEALIPYVIGTIIIYGGVGIWKMMTVILEDLIV